MRCQLRFMNQIIVLPPRPPGAISVLESFNHSGGSISVEGSSARYRGGAPDVCGDCSPLDMLLMGSGRTLVEFPFAF